MLDSLGPPHVYGISGMPGSIPGICSMYAAQPGIHGGIPDTYGMPGSILGI